MRLVGNKYSKKLVCKTMLLLPEEIVDYVTKNVWFLSSFDDSWAYTYDGNDFKNQKLIFLSDELLSQDENQIKFTIVHEIGHVMLKHKNATYTVQTKQHVLKQEKEANEFAQRFTAK